MLRMVLSGLLVLSGLALLFGFGGRFHGMGDTLAVIRPGLLPIVGLLSLILLLVRPRRLGLAGLCVAVLGGMSLVPPAPVSKLPEGTRSYSAYQKNLLFLLPDIDPVASDIQKTGADFVMLQELHARNRSILKRLRAEYPYQHFCPFASVGGIAVLSRWPAVEGRKICGEGSGLAAMQVKTPDGALWVVSLHLHWPFPYRQSGQIEVLLPILDALEAPVLLGGDFNMVPWSYAVNAISRATESKLSGYAGGTFAFSYHRNSRNLAAHLPLLPIDHVLVPKSGAAISLQKREKSGSDHHGLLAVFALDARF